MIVIETKTEYEWHVARAEMIGLVMEQKARVIDTSHQHLTIQKDGGQVKLLRPPMKETPCQTSSL